MPNNLPGELTSFIGRRTELAEIGDSLGGRLLTLTGAGGCGKTRPSIVALVVDPKITVVVSKVTDSVVLDTTTVILGRCAGGWRRASNLSSRAQVFRA